MRHLLVLVLLAGACAGCALSSDTVGLAYHAAPAPPVPGAAGVTVQVDVTDRRGGNPAGVGAGVNGLGLELSAIRADRPVAAIVADAVADELRARGFSVGPSRVRLVVDVDRFRNTFDRGFSPADARGEVTLAAQVRNAGGEITFSRTVTGRAIEAGVRTMGGDTARAALGRALPDAIGRLLADPAFFHALVHSGPQTVS